jgi:predicted 3-demethylubiquinone-9 3-methyltransferase (glyoxalase superfamily)
MKSFVINIYQQSMKKITPFLWFNNNAEEAMNFYLKLFPDSKINSIYKFPDDMGGHASEGKVMNGSFTLGGHEYIFMDGGSEFPFTEAFSLSVDCEDQAEVDRLWNALTVDGGEESQCGWLKDKFGLSWQIIPKQLGELMGDSDPEKSQRVTQAMLKMKKIIVADLQKAYDGK